MPRPSAARPSASEAHAGLGLLQFPETRDFSTFAAAVLSPDLRRAAPPRERRRSAEAPRASRARPGPAPVAQATARPSRDGAGGGHVPRAGSGRRRPPRLRRHVTGRRATWRRPRCGAGAERPRPQRGPAGGEGRRPAGQAWGRRSLPLCRRRHSPRAVPAGTGRHDGQGPGSIPGVLRAPGPAPAGVWAQRPRRAPLRPPLSSLLPSQVGSSVGAGARAGEAPGDHVRARPRALPQPGG